MKKHVVMHQLKGRKASVQGCISTATEMKSLVKMLQAHILAPPLTQDIEFSQAQVTKLLEQTFFALSVYISLLQSLEIGVDREIEKLQDEINHDLKPVSGGKNVSVP